MNQFDPNVSAHNNKWAEVARVFAQATVVGSAALVVLIWFYFVNTVDGQKLDNAAFQGAVYGKHHLWGIASSILNTVSITYIVLSILVIGAIALIQKRWVLAAQVVAVVAGANITTQVVKATLGRPDFDVAWGPANTLPSGHTTVAAATGVALLLAAPRAWRPIAAIIGSGFTAAMGVSTLVGQWHRMSDVLAAILVTCAWGALVCVFATRKGADPVEQRSGIWTPAAAGALGIVAIAAGGLAIWQFQGAYKAIQLGQVITYDQQVDAYLGSVSATVALSALVFTVLLLLRQATTRIR